MMVIRLIKLFLIVILRGVDFYHSSILLHHISFLDFNDIFFIIVRRNIASPSNFNSLVVRMNLVFLISIRIINSLRLYILILVICLLIIIIVLIFWFNNSVLLCIILVDLFSALMLTV